MQPEQKARQRIDQLLAQAGWIVQDFRDLNIFAGRGVAVREFHLKSGFGRVDYLLYADAKAIGVIEAKPAGHTLTGVETQSGKYVDGLPAGLPAHRLPLPFAYESTGEVTHFTNAMEPDARSRRVFTFHRPEELIRLVGLDEQTRSLLRKLPALDASRLWPVQVQTIKHLEKSLADNRPRSLIQMATGSGKTFTAVNIVYRLIRFAGAKRILFLVDRNNLGRQTNNEFQQFISPYNSYKFTEEYSVQQLKRNTIDPAAKVCITTIQRLYSILKGEEEFLEENEEGSLFEAETGLVKEPLPVVYNAKIPIETFDFIIVDECHRSIYNVWRQVLEYFDSFLIGLTATPTAQTIGFFGGNLVQEYTHEQAVADGVNVGFDVYRIETQITNDGARLAREPGVFVPHRDRRTNATKYKELDEDLVYAGSQLDRDVVAEDQIRLVLRTFKERLPEIFPGRKEVPKTLIFAKTDLHAEDIVRITREIFGKGNDFCQKITSKSTGATPETLLAQFRTNYYPRIAVTVDMIATGTDVKPLECLLFMRMIRSMAYFEQMKGRGCRIIDVDSLQGVTPDATGKTHFVIVDAVGVCDADKSCSKPLDRKPFVPLSTILNFVAAGGADADTVSTLASRLARLSRQLTPTQQASIATVSGGQNVPALTASLLNSIDPDENAKRAAVKFNVPAGDAPTEQQLQQVEQERMREALKPFTQPALRKAIIQTQEQLIQVIDETTADRLLRAGFDAAALDKARTLVTTFRQFIEEHKDEIEALKVLYSQPYKAGLRYSQVKQLAAEIQKPPHMLNPERLWMAFEALEPEKVKGHGGRHLVDVIALVRHALDPTQLLAPFGLTVDERYQKWLKDQASAGATFTDEQRRWLDAIKDHIARSLTIESEDFADVPFSQFGGLGRAYELFGDKLNPLLDDLNARLAA
jgi:type I restriction enzyme, R subunit